MRLNTPDTDTRRFGVAVPEDGGVVAAALGLVGPEPWSSVLDDGSAFLRRTIELRRSPLAPELKRARRTVQVGQFGEVVVRLR